MEKLITAKQASDLHTSSLAQRVVHRYLTNYDVKKHLEEVKNMYKSQRDCMVSMIKEYFPPEVKYTQPEGGMFLWVTLPEGMSSMELFELAMKEKVAFVPGKAFYADDPEDNTLRMNFSNSDKEKIEEGIKRLGKVIGELLIEKKLLGS
jgi:2-aminoadipate transaminase